MKNKFYYYQLLDEREEQQLHKAGAESFLLIQIFSKYLQRRFFVLLDRL